MTRSRENSTWATRLMPSTQRFTMLPTNQLKGSMRTYKIKTKIINIKRHLLAKT